MKQQELPGRTPLRFPYKLGQVFESGIKLLFMITGPMVRKFINCSSASTPGLQVSSHEQQSRLRAQILKDLCNHVAYIRIHLTSQFRLVLFLKNCFNNKYSKEKFVLMFSHYISDIRVCNETPYLEMNSDRFSGVCIQSSSWMQVGQSATEDQIRVVG